MKVLVRKVKLTLEMIKFEHSVFALPFALVGAALAYRDAGYQVEDLWTKLFWIIVAMVAARSAAMTFNRIADADIDARNPRTRHRHIPAGLLSRRFAWAFLIFQSALFIVAAGQLNELCLKLSPVALAVIFLYSYTKRFTSLSHLVLGFALGIAPAAAWIAVRGSFDSRILLLVSAVMFWVAGFDIIYACQDYEFDRREGLFSLPARVGIARALLISRLFHGAMVGCLLMLVKVFGLGGASLLGVLLVALLLAYEQSLVRADDLSRVDTAFFTMNGYIGILFAVFWLLDIALISKGA